MFGDMVLRCMPKYSPGGLHWTIYDHFWILCQSSNPQYWKIWSIWGLQFPGGISSFFPSNFPSNATRIMSGEPFSIPFMTIFINVTILDIYIYIYIPPHPHRTPTPTSPSLHLTSPIPHPHRTLTSPPLPPHGSNGCTTILTWAWNCQSSAQRERNIALSWA